MMGNKTKNMIQSFWQGSLGKEDAKILLDTLDEEKVIIQQQLEKQFEENSVQLLSPEQSDKLLQAIHSKAGIVASPIKKIYPYRWLSVAAAVLLLITIGILYRLQYASPTEKEYLVTSESQVIKHIITAGKDSIQHQMIDGSLVTLSPHSTIYFDSGYGIINRAISLSGEGRFAVQRDTSLPFEVTANGFKTTALGTEFIVDGLKDDQTSIHLLSGKVVIHATAAAKLSIQDTYLASGEVVHIDARLRTVLRQQIPSTTTIPAVKKSMEQLIVNKNKRINLRFEKQELEDVIEQIAKQFNTPIILDREVPNTLTFTGEFSAKDELVTILQTICLVNDLEYHRSKDSKVIIQLKSSIWHNATDTVELKSPKNN